MNRAICLLTAVMLSGTSVAAHGADTIPLHIAIEKGLVDVQVNGRGSSTGDSVQVTVRRKTPQNVVISVQPGTVLNSHSGDVQSMTLGGVKYQKVESGYRRATVIELNDDRRHIYIMEGYCRDIGKPTPKARDEFSVQSPDKEDATVLVHAKRLGATVKVTQAAIWIQRSKVSDEQLMQRFRISSQEVGAARELLASVERPELKLDVKVMLDRLRETLKDIEGDRVIGRGDTVAVVTQDAELTRPRGGQVLAKLDKGVELEVVRATEKRVFVTVEVDGKRQRGFLKVADVKLVKSAPRPALDLLRRAASEVRLEVFDKVDIQINNN